MGDILNEHQEPPKKPTVMASGIRHHLKNSCPICHSISVPDVQGRCHPPRALADDTFLERLPTKHTTANQPINIPMQNPTRRNRNIGTARQGHGQDNDMTIPESWYDSRAYFEKLDAPLVMDTEGFTFLVEPTRPETAHACTPEDILAVLEQVPAEDLTGMNLIVLRQPTRKEDMLHPVWGRMVYAFEFRGASQPAIVLEAVDLTKKLVYSKKMSLARQAEFARLQEDGFIFVEDKRSFTTRFDLQTCRNTQLYRTLLHEIGHYVHYTRSTQAADAAKDTDEASEKRRERYFQIPSRQKERFADDYADQLGKSLRAKGAIPFPRIWHDSFMTKHGLNPADFTDKL